MNTTWILIANATHARVLRQEGDNRVTVLESFEHPQSRIKIGDLADDRAGQERTDRSFSGTAYTPRIDTKQKEHLRFARELSDFLERQARLNRFESLEVFASSPFLGELKAELGSATAQLVSGTHDLDLTAVGPAELGPRIAHEMAH